VFRESGEMPRGRR